MLAWGPLGILILAVVDSAGIPIPGGVDALLVAFAANYPGSAVLAAAAAVGGSVLGNLILFLLARKGGQKYLDAHLQTPRGKRFQLWFQQYGLLTVFIPAVLVIPLPLKVFVLCAGAMGIRLTTFLAVVLAARIPRYGFLAYLGVQVGENSLAYLKDHAGELLLISLALFVFLAILIKLQVLWRNLRDRAE